MYNRNTALIGGGGGGREGGSLSAYLLYYNLLTADGLALGAAAGLSKANVEFIIFMAIMLHKVHTSVCVRAVDYTSCVCVYVCT